MRALVLYYSYSGNTAGVARRISELLGCDIAEIHTVTPYASDFDKVVSQAQQETSRGYQPPIMPLAHNPQDYDTVIIGTPIWWYTFASPVKTALAAVDWSGKRVYTFATNAGWPGHTFEDFARACTGADVQPGFDVRFNETRMVTAQAEIDRWAEGIQGA